MLGKELLGCPPPAKCTINKSSHNCSLYTLTLNYYKLFSKIFQEVNYALSNSYNNAESSSLKTCLIVIPSFS